MNMTQIDYSCTEKCSDALDEVAARVGVTRQSVIKLWLVERLKQERET